MIAKIIKGRGFKGVLSYLLGKRGEIISSNMAGNTVKELALEFGQLRKLRPQLGKAVAHIPLSAHPDDRALTDSELADIANQLAVGLGYEDCARVVVRHTDTDH